MRSIGKLGNRNKLKMGGGRKTSLTHLLRFWNSPKIRGRRESIQALAALSFVLKVMTSIRGAGDNQRHSFAIIDHLVP